MYQQFLKLEWQIKKKTHLNGICLGRGFETIAGGQCQHAAIVRQIHRPGHHEQRLRLDIQENNRRARRTDFRTPVGAGQLDLLETTITADLSY